MWKPAHERLPWRRLSSMMSDLVTFAGAPSVSRLPRVIALIALSGLAVTVGCSAGVSGGIGTARNPKVPKKVTKEVDDEGPTNPSSLRGSLEVRRAPGVTTLSVLVPDDAAEGSQASMSLLKNGAVIERKGVDVPRRKRGEARRVGADLKWPDLGALPDVRSPKDAAGTYTVRFWIEGRAKTEHTFTLEAVPGIAGNGALLLRGEGAPKEAWWLAEPGRRDTDREPYDPMEVSTDARGHDGVLRVPVELDGARHAHGIVAVWFAGSKPIHTDSVVVRRSFGKGVPSRYVTTLVTAPTSRGGGFPRNGVFTCVVAVDGVPVGAWRVLAASRWLDGAAPKATHVERVDPRPRLSKAEEDEAAGAGKAQLEEIEAKYGKLNRMMADVGANLGRCKKAREALAASAAGDDPLTTLRTVAVELLDCK